MFIFHVARGALDCFEVSNVPLFSLSSLCVHLPIHLCGLYGELWMDVPWKTKGWGCVSSAILILVFPYHTLKWILKTCKFQDKDLENKAGLMLQCLLCLMFLIRGLGGWGTGWGIGECWMFSSFIWINHKPKRKVRQKPRGFIPMRTGN